jgi:AcrR family transcriptional regulator
MGIDGVVSSGTPDHDQSQDQTPKEAPERRATGRGPGRPRNTAHDAAIVAAAQELLARSGYNSLTIDSVASLAGVGRPTIYRRWPSKAALVIGALGENVSEAEEVPDTGTLRGDLLAIRQKQLELYNSPEGQKVLPGLAADMADHPELHPRFHQRYVAPWRRAVEQAVQRSVARGELPAGTDDRLIADVLTGPLIFRVLFANEDIDPVALEPAVDLVLAGLQSGQFGAPPPGGRRDGGDGSGQARAS